METSRRTDGNHPPSAGFTGVGSDLHGRILAALRLSEQLLSGVSASGSVHSRAQRRAPATRIPAREDLLRDPVPRRDPHAARRPDRRRAQPRHGRRARAGLRDPALRRRRPRGPAARDRRRRRDPGAQRHPGRRRGARRGPPAQGRRPRRRGPRQRRRPHRDPERRDGGQRPDLQHRQRRRARGGAHALRGPAHQPGARRPAQRRVEAFALHRGRALREDRGHRRARPDRGARRAAARAPSGCA